MVERDALAMYEPLPGQEDFDFIKHNSIYANESREECSVWRSSNLRSI